MGWSGPEMGSKTPSGREERRWLWALGRLGWAGHTGLRWQEVWEGLLMAVYSPQAAGCPGQSDKRAEIGFLELYPPDSCLLSQAPETLTVFSGAALALSPRLPEVHRPWPQPSWVSPDGRPAPCPSVVR